MHWLGSTCCESFNDQSVTIAGNFAPQGGGIKMEFGITNDYTSKFFSKIILNSNATLNIIDNWMKHVKIITHVSFNSTARKTQNKYAFQGTEQISEEMLFWVAAYHTVILYSTKHQLSS